MIHASVAYRMGDLAALPGASAGRYLVEQGPLFVRLTAERDLVPTASESRPAHGLLALGAVDFDASSAPASARPGTIGTAGFWRFPAGSLAVATPPTPRAWLSASALPVLSEVPSAKPCVAR